MSEINEEKTLYPRLPRVTNNNEPSAPVAIFEADNGQSFRLKKISDVSDYLEKEIKERQRLSKKYLKISKTTDGIEAGLTVFALGSSAGGIALLSTVVAIPGAIVLEGVALGVGLGALVSKFIVRRSRTKSEKHRHIQAIAESKQNTLNSLISRAISDNKISHEEFNLILGELEKYKVMKEEIRSKTRKKLNTEEEKSLIERGKNEVREEMRRLMENPIGSIRR